MTNTLDELMDRDPLELSAQDIDAIVAYQRKARAAFDSGVKPKKHTADGPTQDLSQVMATLIPKPATPKLRRI